ncbi:MAG TPA: carbohydrate-binding family 9-like protein, partial [Sandaracinaceae bacterium]
MTRRRVLPWLALSIVLFALTAWPPAAAMQEHAARPELAVPRVEDFAVTGRGDNPAWQAVPWTPLNARNNVTDAPATRIKVAYSSTGIYVFMDAADRKLTATYEEDFSDLWKEDVFEVFLWPDERDPLYFEYEISPLGRELPILIPNLEGRFLGWRPWHYSGDRRVRHETSIVGGPKTSGATIEGWRAEIKIPFALLEPLRNVPPQTGTRWRANFYRVDHDDGRAIQWDWARVSRSFHDF